MKKNFAVLSLLFASTFAFACKPSWISNPEKKYSPEKYIVAVGSASSKATAESNAKLALCQQLGEKISGSQRTTSYVDSDGGNFGSIDIDISEQAIFSHIYGISIKSTYNERKKNTYYALAVLKKNDGIKYYSSRIASSDIEISDLVSTARGMKGQIASIPAIRKAVSLAQDNEYCIQILAAITSSGRTPVSYGSATSIMKMAYELAQAVTVKVDITGDEASDIKKTFVTALKDFGLNVISSDDAKYILSGTSSIKPVDVPGQEGYLFVRYVVDAVLKSVDGTVIKEFDISGREGHLSIPQAKNRALSMIKEEIKLF